MTEFDASSMAKIIAFIGEKDEGIRKELRLTLNRAGVKQVSAHDNLANIASLVKQVSPDLLILSDDLDPGVFEFIRSVRHNKIGTNPFVLITTLISPDRPDAVKMAMQAGTDDIIIKPVKEDLLLQRLKRVTVNRAAFVVTSDYLGPDRRGKTRPSNIRRINVLNTMLEKANGNEVSLADVKGAVDESMNEVLQARLDSHGYRLGFICNLILDAYQTKSITPEVQTKLEVLVEVLKDASKTAERLGEKELMMLCGSMSTNVAAIVTRYDKPTQKDIELIEKITKAVVSAVKPKALPENIEQETKQAAENYQQRQREGFEHVEEIKRGQDEPPVEDFDEPAIEILPLAKGKYLFKQGEEATAAYILNSGTIAIYKEKDGQKVPVAKVKKGEFFGEMAIVDGTVRRASAFALEDSTLSLISKQMIEEKMEKSDSLVRSVVHMLVNSLRMVHEVYTPKARNIVDTLREIKDQSDIITGYLGSPTASPELKKHAGETVKKLAVVAADIVKLVEKHSEADRRNPALPRQKELPD